MVLRADNLEPSDVRFTYFREAVVNALPITKDKIGDGWMGYPTWPLNYSWYSMWMHSSDFNESFLTIYRARIATELAGNNVVVRWHLGAVRSDGKVLYAD